ncbi:MAG TPA: FAD-dependent monooxygenase [Novosphingobium sp.]|nr:FAD-dependent monooxygenase [Novosphingobium sp.]
MQFHLNGFRAGDPDVQPAQPWRDGSGALPAEVDVLIAGCGPAGLCLAAQLAQAPSIRAMIVEPKLAPMEKGQADGINLRSMEMFQAFGFADRIKRESVWINETTFWTPDPAKAGSIHRIGRVQDVADGLSEMPHVLINQARIHDMFLDLMRNAPSRMEPDYGWGVQGLVVDPDAADYPVTVTLASTRPGEEGRTAIVRARYVVGCDGARSAVRTAIGGALHGDAAHQAWGVMDVLAVTDFPDIRMKAIIQSAGDGTILLLPREGGYLVRLYVELDQLAEDERVADRGMGVDDIIAKARRILQPYSFDVKEVVWWSIYEIGHRLTDTFDDVPAGAQASRTPRVMLAGDACHTHSPKAGQGMNVSMGDTFNLGWKLISVLTGRTAPDLLHSYTAERRAAAKALVDFDHRWSRVVGTLDEQVDASMPKVQREFIANGEFTAGLTVRYEASALTGPDSWQALATGFDLGKRFHSAPVIRLADAKPMQLGHAILADNRWRIFAFAPMSDHGQPGGAVHALCDFLENGATSPIRRHTRAGEDFDAVIDLRAVFQQHFRDLDYGAMPSALRPHKGVHGLCDYEKVFCADLKSGEDIFAMRGIDRSQGCIVVVRPDQYVAQILPLSAHRELADFFAGFLIPA